MAHVPPYPLFLDLVQRPVLVVGAGAVGLRKTKGLLECAARVTVVSTDFAPGFDKLTDIERIHAPYAATHMAKKPWRLVFAATNIQEVNDQVQKHAAAAGILCCRSDEPEVSDFSSGASERVGATKKSDGRGVSTAANAGGLLLAVSTAGASPVLAARICREAAAGIDPILPILINLLADWRAQIKMEIADPPARRALLLRLASEAMESCLRKEGSEAAQCLFSQWLAEARPASKTTSIPGTPSPSHAPTPLRPSRTVKHAP